MEFYGVKISKQKQYDTFKYYCLIIYLTKNIGGKKEGVLQGATNEHCNEMQYTTQ